MSIGCNFVQPGRNNNSDAQDFAVHCKIKLTAELMFKLLSFADWDTRKDLKFLARTACV
jgi:hypothetical protein